MMEKNPSQTAQWRRRNAQYRSDLGLDRLRRNCGLHARGSKAGRVTCLKCDQYFDSEDRTQIRVCSPCKNLKDWRGSAETDALYPSVGSVLEFQTKGPGTRPPKPTTKNAWKTHASYQKKMRGQKGSQK